MLKSAIPLDEAKRLATLQALHILDTPPEERFDRITRLAQRLFNVPIVLISLVDANRQWFKSRQGLSVSETPRDISFCSHAILHEDALVIPDTTLDPRFLDNPLVTGEPSIRFYAGRPLTGLDGSKLGTLCLIDRCPREMNHADLKTLHDLATLVENEINSVDLSQASEIVRGSEAWFRSMADTAPVIIWMSGPDKLCTYFNQGWLDYTGRTMEQELGNGWAEGVHPEDFDRCLRTYVEAFDRREPFEMEYRLRKGDGRYGWIFDRGVPRILPSGEFAGYIGSCLEITERKRAEEAERMRTALTRAQEEALIELAKDRAIHGGELESAFRIITEVAARILSVGRASVWLFEADRLAIRAMDLYELEQDRHSSGTILLARDYPAYFRALELEKRAVDAQDAHTDPRTREFLAFYLTPLGIGAMLDAPIRLKGEVVGVLCHEHLGDPRTWTPEEQNVAASLATMVTLAMEANERRKADALLTAIVENIPDMIFVKDAKNHTFVRFNKAGEELLGYSREELVGKSDYDLFPKEEADFFTAKDREVLEGRQLLDIPEEPIKTRQKGLRFLHTKKVPIIGPDGIPQYLLGISEDITERKRTEQALRESEGVVRDLRRQLTDKAHVQDLLGRSKAMGLVFQQIRQVAIVDSTVLIEGETGTGKELVARAIHSLSQRKNKPFIALNCAGLTNSLLGSQLFGHKKGSFTGAIEDHQGVFEATSGGTLFLDEIGDIPPNVQTSLLRVLQEKEITRLGESRPRRIDVRVLVATHHNLSQDVLKGTMRADLLYRIRVARIQLPPLRERRDDIPLLVNSFLEQHRAFTGKSVHEVRSEAMGILLDYPWPGNVRELKSAIESAVIRCDGSVIRPQDLPPEILDAHGFHMPSGTPATDEKTCLLAALQTARGNREVAARLLGMSRATLYRRLAEFKLPRTR